MAAAEERLRWEGRTEERLEEHDRRLDTINGSIARGAGALVELRLEVKGLATRVGVWAAVGAAVSSAVVSVAVGIAVAVLTN